jgi:hypothetical protein
MRIASCAALQQIAVLPTCTDGDAFVLTGVEDPAIRGAQRRPTEKHRSLWRIR